MPSKPPAPSDLADKFMLRLPDGMRDRLKEAAAQNNRSMNGEIVARLEASFSDAPVIPADKAADIVSALVRAIQNLQMGKPGSTILTSDSDSQEETEK